MHHNVNEIQEDPPQFIIPLGMPGFDLRFQFILDVIYNGFDLGIGITGDDDKIVGNTG